MSYTPFDVPSDPTGAVTDVSRPLLHRMNQATLSASTLEGLVELLEWAYGEIPAMQARFDANQKSFGLPTGARATERAVAEPSPVSEGLSPKKDPEVVSEPANAVPETLAEKPANPSAGNVPGAPIPKGWEGDNAPAPASTPAVVEEVPVKLEETATPTIEFAEDFKVDEKPVEEVKEVVKAPPPATAPKTVSTKTVTKKTAA